MRSRSLVYLLIFAVIIAALAITGYFMDKKTVDYGNTPTPTETPIDTNDQPTPGPSVTSSTIPLPGTTTTADMTSWKVYSDKKAGYSISYPGDLLVSTDSGTLTLIFPKNVYFHWPLQDDVKVTVSVASKCPAIQAGNMLNAGAADFALNGYNFHRTVGNDVAAGNRYQEIAYDTTVGASCYHIDFLDHGANGAGLYVDDAALIKKYDAVQQNDLSKAISILNAMIGTFRILAQ